jgi:hypothetical protein
MLLLPLDEYCQTKHIGHRPCMWEDTDTISLIAAAAWMPVQVGGVPAMVCSDASALMCPQRLKKSNVLASCLLAKHKFSFLTDK